MLAAGCRLGIAVSGGADSVCLLHILRELAPRWNLHLSIIHVDHGLRGEESAGDALFVCDLAGQFGIPLRLRSLDLRDCEGNLEQEARRARHAFYRELIMTGKVDRVATGHTRSDQAETVLYRILRGAGTAGLAGILPVIDGVIVRPLLGVTREQVRDWLRFCGHGWREDSSNATLHYARNRIRAELLPLLRSTYNPGIDEVLADMAKLAADEEDWWELQVRAPDLLRGTALLAVGEIVAAHPAVARRSIRAALRAVKGDLRQIDFRHIEYVRGMALKDEGTGRVQLPGIDVFRSFDWIRIAPSGYDSARQRQYEFAVTAPGQAELPDGTKITLELAPASPESHDNLGNELDWDGLSSLAGPAGAASGQLELRNWRPGDQYLSTSRPHHEKIKTMFQDARVPLWERRWWPVLLCAGEVVWSRRFGVARSVAAGPQTRLLLRIREQDRTVS